MSNGLIETNITDITHLSPTYRILTAERILDRFNIHLSHDVLSAVMNNPRSLYFQILVVPFQNIINGIILQQTYDYQVYAQKLFVDFLVSGEGNDDPESPGANVRHDLEDSRLKLVALGEDFDKDIHAHKTLIHQTQTCLLKTIKTSSVIEDNEESTQPIIEAMIPFLERATALAEALRHYRLAFRELILETLRLIDLLPEYRLDAVQEADNRATLEFDEQL